MSYPSRRTYTRSGKRSVRITLALLATIVGLGALRWLQNRSASAPATATLLIVSGEALVTQAEGEPGTPLHEGETISLQSGDEIATGKVSRARLTFEGGESIELGSDTRLAILELCLSPVTHVVRAALALHQGETLTRIPHSLLEGAEFEIETKVATLRARGAKFQCDALADQAYVAVFEGLVTVSMGEQSIQLEAGQSVQARLGQPLVSATVSQPSPLEPIKVPPFESEVTPTLTDREKTLFPPVLTPTLPGDLFQLYTVQEGDTLYSIASRFGLSWEAVFAANKGQLRSPELIRVDQQLRIPKR